MAFMSKDEAAAVIGHELGHFTGADTEYSLQFSPIYASAVNNLRAVDMASEDDSGIMSWLAKPATMLGDFFLNSFDLAVQHWSRVREFAADAMGAAVASSEAIALSLLRISVLAPHVDGVLAEFWNKGGKVDGGVLARVQGLVRERGLADPSEHLEDAQAHPTDSHPTVRQRLEALGVEATPSLMDRARSRECSTLLQELGLSGESQAAAASGVLCDAAAPLSSALEAEFSKIAQDNAEGMTQELRDMAALGTEPMPFYEGGIVVLGFIVFMGAFVGFFGSLGVLGLLGRGKSDEFSIGLSMLSVGVILLALAWYKFTLRKKPFVTLTAKGLLFADLQSELPWTVVDDYNITTNSTNGATTSVTIVLDIADGYEVPAFKGDRRAKYKAKKQQLTFTILNFRGRINAEKFNEEFATYWRGGLSRARLAAME